MRETMEGFAFNESVFSREKKKNDLEASQMVFFKLSGFNPSGKTMSIGSELPQKSGHELGINLQIEGTYGRFTVVDCKSGGVLRDIRTKHIRHIPQNERIFG